MLDEFGSENKEDYVAGFPPHPHRGIETVTYMLQGEFEHEDSTGSKGKMAPGDVQWMKTGRGIIHSEMPAMTGGKLLGFQLWINMPAKLKKNKPEYLYIKNNELGVHKDSEKTVKVIAGKYEKAEGPQTNHNVEPIYFHIVLNEKKEFKCEIPEGHNSFIYLLKGQLQIGEKEHNGVLGQPILFQLYEQVPHFLVHRGHTVMKTGDRFANYRGVRIVGRESDFGRIMDLVTGQLGLDFILKAFIWPDHGPALMGCHQGENRKERLLFIVPIAPVCISGVFIP